MEKFLTKKSLGQHFLNNATVPNWLVTAGAVLPTDTVLEIGPGTGVLTQALLATGAKVIALEADSRAIVVLEDKFSQEILSGQLEIKNVDIREFNIKTLLLADHSFKVIANIPYYLTGFLFRLFLADSVQPATLVFLVQKEVGKRATSDLARNEKESLLSLSIKAFGQPKYIRTVGKGHFTPPPNVDSAIVAIYDINRKNFETVPPELYFEILHLGFGSKRKQLISNLSKKYQRTELEDIFTKLELAKDVRAEDVPLKKWLDLAKNLKH